jgi:hypothetical protein
LTCGNGPQMRLRDTSATLAVSDSSEPAHAGGDSMRCRDPHLPRRFAEVFRPQSQGHPRGGLREWRPFNRPFPSRPSPSCVSGEGSTLAGRGALRISGGSTIRSMFFSICCLQLGWDRSDCVPPFTRRVLFVYSVVVSSPLDCDLIG